MADDNDKECRAPVATLDARVIRRGTTNDDGNNYSSCRRVQ
jgi:hypothetical protein